MMLPTVAEAEHGLSPDDLVRLDDGKGRRQTGHFVNISSVAARQTCARAFERVCWDSWGGWRPTYYGTRLGPRAVSSISP
jgi:hypothetical protein